MLIGDAKALWALLIGYLRLLGAAYADVVEFIADGAEWMWKRVERLRTLAEIPPSEAVVKPCWRSAEGLAKQRSWYHTLTNFMIKWGRINYEHRLSLCNRFNR